MYAGPNVVMRVQGKLWITNSQIHHIPYTASLLLMWNTNSRSEIWRVRWRYNKSCRRESGEGDSEEDRSSSKLCKILHLHNGISRQKIVAACFGSDLNALSTHQFALIYKYTIPPNTNLAGKGIRHCEIHAKYISKSSLNQWPCNAVFLTDHQVLRQRSLTSILMFAPCINDN